MVYVFGVSTEKPPKCPWQLHFILMRFSARVIALYKNNKFRGLFQAFVKKKQQTCDIQG
jgi:hypothetical protein